MSVSSADCCAAYWDRLGWCIPWAEVVDTEKDLIYGQLLPERSVPPSPGMPANDARQQPRIASMPATAVVVMAGMKQNTVKESGLPHD